MKVNNVYCETEEEFRAKNPEIIIHCDVCKTSIGLPLKTLMSDYELKCQNGHIVEEGFKKALLKRIRKEAKKRKVQKFKDRIIKILKNTLNEG